MIVLIALLFFLNNFASSESATVNVSDTTFCYFLKENVNRPYPSGNSRGGHCNNSNVPTGTCTYYSLYSLNFDIDVNIEQPPASGEGSYADLNSMRRRDVDFNILLTLTSDVFGEVISDQQKRTLLLTKCIQMVRDNQLNGIDFYLDTSAQYKDDITDFLKTARDMFGSQYRLVVSIRPFVDEVGCIYNISAISEYPDLVVIRTDLLFDTNSRYTVPKDPVYSLNSNIQEISSISVDSSVRNLLDSGLDNTKAVVTFSGSGLSFRTASSNDPSVGLSVTGIGAPGPYSITPGLLAYFEICELRDNNIVNVTNANDNGYSVAVNGNNWIGYMDVQPAVQVGLYVNRNKLKGVAISNICDDDFDGRCRDGKFVLIVSASNSMMSGFDVGSIGPRGVTGPVVNTAASEGTELTQANPQTVETLPVVVGA